MTKPISNRQAEYLAEYEKYKHIVILSGRNYVLKSNLFFKYFVIEVNGEEVKLMNLKTGNEVTKTLHWCRKNLIEILDTFTQ